jgi:hypothetical protein
MRCKLVMVQRLAFRGQEDSVDAADALSASPGGRAAGETSVAGVRAMAAADLAAGAGMGGVEIVAEPARSAAGPLGGPGPAPRAGKVATEPERGAPGAVRESGRSAAGPRGDPARAPSSSADTVVMVAAGTVGNAVESAAESARSAAQSARAAAGSAGAAAGNLFAGLPPLLMLLLGVAVGIAVGIAVGVVVWTFAG